MTRALAWLAGLATAAAGVFAALWRSASQARELAAVTADRDRWRAAAEGWKAEADAARSVLERERSGRAAEVARLEKERDELRAQLRRFESSADRSDRMGGPS